MKIYKDNLEDSLGVTGTTLSNSGTSIDTHYLFRPTPDKGHVEVLSFTGRVFSSSQIPTVDEPISAMFTVEGSRLNSAVSVIPDGEITMTCENADIRFSTSRGTLYFSSLDPSGFPFWDDLLRDSKSTVTMKASLLHAAMTYSQKWVMPKDDPQNLALSVMEARNGGLNSSCKSAVAFVVIPGFENASFRIHGSDVGRVTSFLSTFKSAKPEDELVEVLEHERACFFRRPDGAVLGVARFSARFPDLKFKWSDPAHYTWEVSKKDLVDSIKFLMAGADAKNPSVRVGLSDEQGKLTMRMPSAYGSKELKATTTILSSSVVPDAGALPSNGAPLPHKYLMTALSAFPSDNVSFGITLAGKGGWARTSFEKDGLTYYTFMSFVHEAPAAAKTSV